MIKLSVLFFFAGCIMVNSDRMSNLITALNRLESEKRNLFTISKTIEKACDLDVDQCEAAVRQTMAQGITIGEQFREMEEDRLKHDAMMERMREYERTRMSDEEVRRVQKECKGVCEYDHNTGHIRQLSPEEQEKYVKKKPEHQSDEL